MTSSVSASAAPQVSILIIAYNQKDFIGEAIQSALDQDYPNLQIVVSDDASTDGTADLIRDYQARHPHRIAAVLNPVNLGITRNSNMALSRCTGEYVAFLGGDDVLLPGKITSQMNWFARDSRRILCGHQVEVFYDDGSRKPHRFQNIMRSGTGAAKFIRYGAYAACSIMVKASRLPPRGFEDALPIVSDYMLWIEVLADEGEFGYVKGTYARYRRHSANITTRIETTFPDFVRALELIKQRYPHYARSCRQARSRFLHYPDGMRKLRDHEKRAARAAFARAIRYDPAFVRPWLGLARTLI